MAPKQRIKPKRRAKPSISLSKKRVTKKKLKDGLLTKVKRTKAKGKGQAAPPPKLPGIPNQRGVSSISPARGPGRPTRFDQSEESFLRNVPDQLKKYAWRPGQSGNLKGCPKGSINLTSRLRGLLATPIEGREKEKGKPAVTYADELMSLALQAARRGDYRFFQHIYERMDGKIPDHVVIEEVQQMVTQESEKVTEEVVKVVAEIALEEFGEKRAAVFREKLTAAMTEKLGEKDAGLRAS